MLIVNNVSLSFGSKPLFKDVNLKFAPGNCYGLIGANGAGKSTFVKILSGDLEPSSGTVSHDPHERIAVLRQDHFAFDDYTVLETVLMGHEQLYKLMKERDEIYAKEDFTDEDGIRAGELEGEFAEMGGYEAEAEAASMLDQLGIDESFLSRKMAELEDQLKVRVLLTQALYGNPDILLLDEPTNHLDLKSIMWLEDFLYNFQNTVIVVSHDRHFLNKVCTHITDIDFGKISIFAGNYSFWQQASQLMQSQLKDSKKKNEEKIKELQNFVQRFSANAAKSKQATARKKLIEKLTPEEMPVTSRKFPYIDFKPERACGNQILTVEGLTLVSEGETLLKDYNLIVNPGEKIAFVGRETLTKTLFFEALAGNITPQAGEIVWGQTITPAYFPKENSAFFDTDLSLIDWLRQYSDNEDQSFVRGFLGRMLFSGEDALKSARVLSGGEKVRCMLSRMMLSGANVLIFDEPTSHLDLESITALNNGLIDFSEVILFSSHDHQFVESIANRIIEFTPGGVIDRMTDFDSYLANEEIQQLRDEMYHGHSDLVL